MTPPKRGPGRPPMAPEERRVRINIMLAPATLAALDELAARAGVGRSAWIEAAVLEAAKPGSK